MKKHLIVLFTLLSVQLYADNKGSFAIIVDKESFSNCMEQIEAYSASVASKGLNSFIAAENWAKPEQVRDSLQLWYRTKNLKGTVFIGNIPVPMIRKAQHLASAFKMDESIDRRESSIPSDRYYDDFDMKFIPVGRDSSQQNLYYYEIAPDSPQEIDCDIFSGRIVPSSDFQNKYLELKKYLEKVVRVNMKGNKLDRVTSYTGSGSFSNSMIAWKDEGITLEEQVPEAFRDINGAKFFVYHQYPFMKETMLKECGRDDLDLVLYHHHGTPDRQWIGDYPAAFNEEEYNEYGRRQARIAARRNVRYGKSREEAIKAVISDYGVDSSWVADAFSSDSIKADSLQDIRTGILLSDIWKAAPNARMYIFDACYNGDIRESDNIASRYIMSNGNAIAAIGNTVNVLQDKMSSQLLGMMTAGYCIGEWHKETAILESLVIGDPTFAFETSYRFKCPDLNNRNPEYWKKYISDKYPCDIQGLALMKLYKLNTAGLAEILYKAIDSKYYMLRLNALSLLMHYDSPLFRKALIKSLEDPYEYTRRKAGCYLSLTGDTASIAPLTKALTEDYNAARIYFNITNGAGFFPDSTFLDGFRSAVKKSGFFYEVPPTSENGIDAVKNAESDIKSSISIRKYAYDAIGKTGSDSKGRQSRLTMLRNKPYPQFADALLYIVKNEKEPIAIRIQAADILGWYTIAYNKKHIYDTLSGYLSEASEPALKDEIGKTILRLKAYLK